jgi:hypothetical protein
MRYTALVIALAVVCAPAQTRGPKKANIPFDEARPIVEALAAKLPVDLMGKSPDEIRAAWPGWVAARDADIRSRLAQGDEDSIVNFMLFGVTFTKQPRATARDVARVGEGKTIADVVAARLEDLVAGIAAPGANERLLFARRVVERKGIDPSTPAGRAKVREYLVVTIQRVLSELTSFQRTVEAAKLLGDPSAEFAERSTLYRDRGLSSDTSIFPNFAIEQSLEAMKAKGLLAPGSVRRVAVVGPGFDYADKGEGYDFYPQQTIQPFAVVDSLVRLGLAKPTDLTLVTFDLSPRINEHLAAARARALKGGAYTVQLVRDPEAGWTPELVSYWERFGDRVGAPVAAATPPAGAGPLKVRAVTIRPAVVASITSEDLNIVLQRPEGLRAAEQFDLVVATNILVYYDVFEQSLALANVSRMLRPGGFLLSNNALLELDATPMHAAGYHTSVYSGRPDDGDHIVWYQRK